MRKFQSQSLFEVVADAATGPSDLTRHELGEGVAVSFLYNGDEENPDTCQWRIVAQNEEQLQQVVWQLVEILTAKGVRCKPAHFSGCVCHFRDEGPWGGSYFVVTNVSGERNTDSVEKVQSMTREYSQKEWDELISKYPNGTPMSGKVCEQQRYGVWVILDELPEIPALLEIIHFKINETRPGYRIQFPNDYPATGTLLETRVLAWSANPKEVRLTQLNHLNWSHQQFLHEQASEVETNPVKENENM